LADVIANTSPLQYLHQVGQLDLFPKLFGRIIVPEAVVLPRHHAATWFAAWDETHGGNHKHLSLPFFGFRRLFTA
jgi:hypothetical protein